MSPAPQVSDGIPSKHCSPLLATVVSLHPCPLNHFFPTKQGLGGS